MTGPRASKVHRYTYGTKTKDWPNSQAHHNRKSRSGSLLKKKKTGSKCSNTIVVLKMWARSNTFYLRFIYINISSVVLQNNKEKEETYKQTVLLHPIRLRVFCSAFPESTCSLHVHFDLDIILCRSKKKSSFWGNKHYMMLHVISSWAPLTPQSCWLTRMGGKKRFRDDDLQPSTSPPSHRQKKMWHCGHDLFIYLAFKVAHVTSHMKHSHG